MELNSKKSTWAALATLGVTAVAAGATAVVKMRKKRQQKKAAKEREELLSSGLLTPEQEMVYNEAVRAFLSLNDRIYELRHQYKELQMLITWLATDDERPVIDTEDDQIAELANDIQTFLVSQVPFINACISTISDDGTTYVDYIRAAKGQHFDPELDVEFSEAEVEPGTPIKNVLKLGYFFPECRIANHPVKSIVMV